MSYSFKALGEHGTSERYILMMLCCYLRDLQTREARVEFIQGLYVYLLQVISDPIFSILEDEE